MRYLSVLLILVIIGCAHVVREEAGVDVPGAFKNAPSGTAPELSRWWQDFNDPVLDGLVEEALQSNHDIRLATERVIEARAGLGISRADLFPTVNLQADLSRQRQSLSMPQGGSYIFDAFSLTPVASYELDIWGRLSSAERASRERLVSSMEAGRTVIHTVIADLVGLYFQRIGLERKIELAHLRVQNLKRTLRIIKGRYRRGLASYLDLLQAETQLSEAEVAVPALRRQAMELSQRISIIAGRYPDEIELGDIDADYIGRLEPIGAGLPSDLLLRRPDLREERARMEAVFEELKVARAKRFPQITLTGRYGWSSDALHSLFRPESVIWQVSAGILTPLFDAGRLRASEEAALSRYRQAIISYAKTVLQAFYEVENALMKRQRLYEERDRLMGLLKQVKKTYDVSMSRYQRGLVDLLRVLELERRLFQTRERLIDVETGILTNRVFLYRALGGTWTDKEGLYEGMG